MNYKNYRKNIFSDNGEDGVIQKLFEDLEIRNGVVCEFGAWDGFVSSNTANLWKNKDFSAVLIESNVQRFAQLKENTKNFLNVECYNYSVSFDQSDSNSIDNILDKSNLLITDTSFALMSIDIDSCDYYIFESITKYLPKVIILETSSGYRPGHEFFSYTDGCSLTSARLLAEKKGYILVCHTGNAIFVRNDLAIKLPDWNFNEENLYTSPEEHIIWTSSKEAQKEG
jgi:hypothetical protein